GFNPRSTEINSNLRSSGSTYIKGYGLLRRKQEPPRSRARMREDGPQSGPSHRTRMREESEDIPKAFAMRSSQEQIPKHLNIPRPPGRGERKCEKRAKIYRKHSQEQIPKHHNIGRSPGKSYPNPHSHPNSNPYSYIYNILYIYMKL